MKQIVLVIATWMMALSMNANSIVGDWTGTLNVQGMKLKVVFHISQKGDVYTSTMDSPDQGAMGIPTEKTTFDGKTLEIEMPSMGINYKGELEDGEIKGEFSQGGMSFALNLKKSDSNADENEDTGAVVPPRPQDPIDFPYHVEEVTIPNEKDNLELGATLTLPKNKKAKKIVILISGSGPQNRDEEVKAFNHRPFLVLSDHLTKKGIGVLRFDDRGVAKSTGNHTTATSADFASDVQAIVTYLKKRKDLKKMSIGLAGHSEGGMIAPMVAANHKDVDFIILLAGPGIPSDQLLLRQTKDLSSASGAEENLQKKTLALNKKLYAFIKKNSDLDDEAFKKGLEAELEKGLEIFSDEEMQGQSKENIIQAQLATASSPWFRYFIAFEPHKNLEAIKCPVLALNGTLDLQVSAKENLQGIENALKKGGNKNYTIQALEGLNHLFQKAETGVVEEYKEIEETMNEDMMDIVANWINELK